MQLNYVKFYSFDLDHDPTILVFKFELDTVKMSVY